MTTTIDRAGLIRRALVELVAERGFRGTSMSAVAQRAGVATGTAYVHYGSKDDLVIAAYCEVKLELGRAAVRYLDSEAPAADRFRRLWLGIYRHLAANPQQARFMVQIDASPYAGEAHAAAARNPDNELLAVASAPDVASLLLDLPPEVLYDLGIAPAVRLAASGEDRPDRQLDTVATACWRAITRP